MMTLLGGVLWVSAVKLNPVCNSLMTHVTYFTYSSTLGTDVMVRSLNNLLDFSVLLR